MKDLTRKMVFIGSILTGITMKTARESLTGSGVLMLNAWSLMKSINSRDGKTGLKGFMMFPGRITLS